MMLANPLANKEQSLNTICAAMDIPLPQTVVFGDDLIDIADAAVGNRCGGVGPA